MLEFLKKTLDYDGSIHLLAVAIRRMTDKNVTEETIWRLRVALTYREGNSINPYWDGTELDIIEEGEELRLLDEQALADEPPMIEGSPNELALDWVSALANPLWISDEARKAAAEGLDVHEAMEAERRKSIEDPFEHYFNEGLNKE
ncbi:hypothetical protein QW71_09695 [Paenibacillus sp. IHB B 3415]|nr:hypothetical protein QW71_09695 [Paenibacillus sp. IHB B 3415]